MTTTCQNCSRKTDSAFLCARCADEAEIQVDIAKRLLNRHMGEPQKWEEIGHYAQQVWIDKARNVIAALGLYKVDNGRLGIFASYRYVSAWFTEDA